ncbi:ABC transporter substrate-binding protein [Actinomyces sp. 565]|uniref:ABC transporter substrate-binding protein n=1 Tax=Actinomyces sp. 565 TaxID=2057794 RepID=UPI0013A6BB25|nr:ABC transporter substrate-binding protein [Actinomyces sp. 565]NDR54617.1 carbohydrate ABC transporter substrate-binding protein [Actinomyces sp. 565]
MRSSRTALHRTAAHLAPAAAALLLLTGGLTACSTGHDVDPTASSTDPCAALAGYGTFPDGTTVTIATAFTGTEAERFDASLEQFEECTGIDVVQNGSDDLEAVLRQTLEEPGAGDDPEADPADATGAEQPPTGTLLPDLAVVPQPGLVSDLARADALAGMPDSVGANVELGWDRSWMEAGSVDGVLYAAPLMASVKSFVWYSPVAFAQAGYEVPTTWDELVALTARIAADNAADGDSTSADGDGEKAEDAQDSSAEERGTDAVVTPWCLGASDGDSTGWVVSDWLEDALLATGGVGAYDAWAGHAVALDDASAVGALDAVGDLLLADGHVPGGGVQAVNTTVEEAGAQLLDGSCYMLHASSGYENLLPEGAEVVAVGGAAGSGTAATQATATPTYAVTGGVVSAFLVPGVADDDAGAPVIVGGDFLVQLSAGASAAGEAAEAGADADAVAAVMTYLSSAEWAQARVDLGGVATANRSVDASRMRSDVARRATVLLQSRQSVIRFDASDSMPSGVGTDALWGALTQWTRGELDSKEALAQAEAAWPQ